VSHAHISQLIEVVNAEMRLRSTDELEGKVKTLKLDWELASDLLQHEDELLAWEEEAFDGHGGRANLIIGADIVSFSLSIRFQLS